jgi:putative addiction module killer protein
MACAIPLINKAIGKRLARVEVGLLGDNASVGDRVSELRIHIGPGYRVDYTNRGNVLVVLLCGGDKGSQDRDINRAKALEALLE